MVGYGQWREKQRWKQRRMIRRGERKRRVMGTTRTWQRQRNRRGEIRDYTASGNGGRHVYLMYKLRTQMWIVIGGSHQTRSCRRTRKIRIRSTRISAGQWGGTSHPSFTQLVEWWLGCEVGRETADKSVRREVTELILKDGRIRTSVDVPSSGEVNTHCYS